MDRRSLLATLPAGVLAATAASHVQVLAQTQMSVVNVRDFGAIGDGVTDDSEAIQRAFASDFRTLIFPAGTYLFSNVSMGQKRGVRIDAADAVFRNSGDRTPLFRLGPGQRLVRSRLHLAEYRSGQRGGYLFDIGNGLISDTRLEIDRVVLQSENGGVIKHHSNKLHREYTEGLFFTDVVGMRWDSTEDAGRKPMIDISSGFNSFSSCNISVRDVRLLSDTLFMKAVCSSEVGSSFLQIRLHDMGVERCYGGFGHFEGMRTSGFSNIGMYDLRARETTTPLFTVRHSELGRNTGGCYCRDIFRARTTFTGSGCDILADPGVIDVTNYHAIGELLRRTA